MIEYEKQLITMLQTQIVGRGINNPSILEAMQRVPRHLFAPNESLERAYGDHPLTLPEEQATISQPYMVAYMTDALHCLPTDRALEIGTGSGYQAAILSYFCKEVYTVERYDTLSKSARRTVQTLERKNVFFRVGDGIQGWKEQSPFDKIIVTAAMRKAPQPLLDQLNDDGVLLIPLGDSRIQTLTRITRRGDTLDMEELIQCVFVPLISKTRDMTQDDDEDSLEFLM